MHPANRRLRYIVATFLIGWAHHKMSSAGNGFDGLIIDYKEKHDSAESKEETIMWITIEWSCPSWPCKWEMHILIDY